MERGQARSIQKKMLEINKKKPSTRQVDDLFNTLEEAGTAEKKSPKRPDKKIAKPPEVDA